MIKPILSAALILAAAAPAATAGDYLDRDSWTWSTSSDVGYESAQSQGLAAIHDGNDQTYWHSNYHADDSSPERRNPHWVMIDRGTDTTPFTGIAYMPRQSSANTACTQWYVYLSDTDMSSCPATSTTDIISNLGQPTYSGSWLGDLDLKTASFGKQHTERYILWVNVASNSSNSAACAEFNLLAGDGGSGGGTSSSVYNSLGIVLPDGTSHHIAIDGSNLVASMERGAIRLGNSDITVEYDIAEVKHFAFEKYSFPEDDPYYVGTKKDVNSPDYPNPFEIGITPADGTTLEEELTSIAIDAKKVNADCTESLTLVKGVRTLLSMTATEVAATAIDGGGFLIPVTGADQNGRYVFTVPEGMFVDPDTGGTSLAASVAWTLKIPESGISKPADATVTFKRVGSDLAVGGLQPGSTVTLHSVGGMLVASAPVGANGTALLPVGSLQHGPYILTANGITLKIII